MSKFTNIEAALLKRLYKEFTLEDLNKIVVKTINSPESYWDVEKKYMSLMKLYGLMPEPNRYGGYDTDKLTELTKYAKWVVDNIPDDLPKDELVDFKNIENPIKTEMKTYEVNASESGSQTMYRSGWVEILAWDEEDAEEKATEDFYEWGGEMEDDDYGDWYGDGIELEHLNLKEQRRLARKYGIISHQPVRPGDMINEHIPQPGSSSAEGIKDDNLSYETQYLTLDEILTNIKSIPYYNEVLDDLKDDKEDWAVTQTVKRYAKYWMEHPESLTSEGFPPIQVIGDGLKDGAHRISTLNALANHIDPDNPYWKEVKLEVRFYPIEVVKDIGPTWVNGELVYNTKDGLNSKKITGETDEAARTLSKARKAGVDAYYPKSAVKANPKRFRKYTRDKYINESKSKINPELKVDDIVRVIDIDGEHGRMPKRFGTYIVVKVGKTYPLMAMRNRGYHNEYYDIRPYPDSSTQFSKLDVKSLYRGDTWIYGDIPMANKVDRKTISESKLKINPELELGDKIRVISVDRDVESKSIKYHIPPPELKPDLYVSYAVVDKESNGSESKYPFRYTLIPEDKYQDYLNGDYWVKRDTSKLLFPWLNQWIYAKETETINEHKKSKFNPELMVGDEVTVVNVDKSYGTMNTPKHLKDYVVTGIKYRQPENWEGPEADTKYYVIVPIGGYSDNEATGRMLSGGGKITEEHLYSTDTWMLRKGFLRGELGERETNIRMLGENWRDTSWEDDDGKITIGDVTDYIGNNIRNISVSDLENKLGDNVSSVTQGEERIMKADLQYPIILVQKDGEFSYVLDGNHRLAKAIMTGEEYIKAKVLYLDDKNTPEEFKRLLGREEVINEYEEGHQPMSKDEVQTIVDKVYPHIINNLGESIYVDELPKVELWEDIYARLSKIPGATGEESESSEAQYEGKENKIFVYYPNMKDVKHVIQSLLHEYTHYLQDPDESEENRKDGYENDPYETAASEAEENWEDYMVYLKDNLNEKFASKAQQRFLYATNKKVAKKLGSKMTKKDYKELPDKVEEDLENWSYDGNSIGVEKELDESINDMVYIKKPSKKHLQKMDNTLGNFKGFNLTEFKNTPPPKNDSKVTENEIKEVQKIKVNKKFVNTTDDIHEHFQDFLKTKDVEYPKKEIKKSMKGLSRIILELKYHYNRPRPEQIAEKKKIKLKPTTLDTASTPSYPSGHALRGRFMGRYLSEKYPEYKNDLIRLGDDIGDGRLMAKVHYPSDDKFGKDLGDKLYDFFKGSNKENLEEYCPMGKPNKCKLVDYNNLPDMVKSETIEEQFGKELTMADAIKRDVMKVLAMRFVLTPTEDSNIKDASGQSYAIVDTDNPFEEVTIEMLIEPIINMFNDGISGGELSPQDTNIAISGVTDWLSLAMNQTVDLPN